MFGSIISSLVGGGASAVSGLISAGSSATSDINSALNKAELDRLTNEKEKEAIKATKKGIVAEVFSAGIDTSKKIRF